MNFINGKFETTTTTMDNKGIIPIYNPSTNNLLSVIPESSSLSSNNNTAAAAVTECAIRAAKEAFPSWSNTPVQNRQQLLLEYTHLLHKKEVREEIA
jgi:malonate-semialdehyde dehydrogenase (acetylating)/methylmalonate-semialdehyde dehydrogenase